MSNLPSNCNGVTARKRLKSFPKRVPVFDFSEYDKQKLHHLFEACWERRENSKRLKKGLVSVYRKKVVQASGRFIADLAFAVAVTEPNGNAREAIENSKASCEAWIAKEVSRIQKILSTHCKIESPMHDVLLPLSRELNAALVSCREAQACLEVYLENLQKFKQSLRRKVGRPKGNRYSFMAGYLARCMQLHGLKLNRATLNKLLDIILPAIGDDNQSPRSVCDAVWADIAYFCDAHETDD